ncbi:MAG: methylmalonyl-CoA mutase family protein, partial [Acidimicrobiales bacterium]
MTEGRKSYYLWVVASSPLHVPSHPVRIVTAASLFDGHDAAINIMRRILQSQGCEVIHLGHNRSVDEIVTAVVQEDVQGVAVSSYQGGHDEFFRYLVDRLRAEGRADVRVYGGGGGVITPTEIDALEAYGVAKIFSPEDGQRMGLAAMINTIVAACDVDPVVEPLVSLDELLAGHHGAVARTITALEVGELPEALRHELRSAAGRSTAPVLGITGTGGSGKSSLTDELVRRVRLDQEDKLRVAILAVDPTRRRGGGALLGDRIRMNSVEPPQVLFRSMATRGSSEVPEVLDDAVAACRAAGFDLIVVETPGIGQGDAGIVEHCDVAVYVMTPEFGAASQLEKIDMLDFADAVVINKFERRGAEDALRDVRRQLARNREQFGVDPASLPVFGTIASRFNDDGVTALYQHLRGELASRGLRVDAGRLPAVDGRTSSKAASIVPADRTRYLAEVAETVRAYHRATDEQAASARLVQQLRAARDVLDERGASTTDIDAAHDDATTALSDETRALLTGWPEVRGELEAVAGRESQSGTLVPRVALPRYADDGELLRFLRDENVPGRFPFTAGVFPLKREGEDPARMFAGEGDAFRTNRRFHLLNEGQPATRLSTAFDSVTLYGFDPDERPDIYGKVGNAGVSICTLDDMEVLYDGFDLCSPTTSVSMTINGPAPTILAFFLNTAIDQQIDWFAEEHGREPDDEERAHIAEFALANVRGTVQADILKEDQGQNTCIFSTEFALGMMADIQEWFVEHEVRSFYSVSISGYH